MIERQTTAGQADVDGQATSSHGPRGAAVDPRLADARWAPRRLDRRGRARLVVLTVLSAAAMCWYLGWLLQPGRVGNPALFAVLLVAELFNVVQAIGFWWTCTIRRVAGATPPRCDPAASQRRRVHPDLRRAGRDRRADRRRGGCAARRRACASAVLDDGNRRGDAALARRHGAGYVRRSVHSGAKAGNINHALGVTSARVRRRPRLRPRARRSASWSARWPRSPTSRVAFVQTPQYYANDGRQHGRRGGVEPAGAVLRADRARQGHPRVDVLLRHQRRVPPRRARVGRRLPGDAR